VTSIDRAICSLTGSSSQSVICGVLGTDAPIRASLCDDLADHGGYFISYQRIHLVHRAPASSERCSERNVPKAEPAVRRAGAA
jgi:hypothetical protein